MSKKLIYGVYYIMGADTRGSIILIFKNFYITFKQKFQEELMENAENKNSQKTENNNEIKNNQRRRRTTNTRNQEVKTRKTCSKKRRTNSKQWI